ncbi:MAG: hypothetical protein U9O98_05865 [Asgard group archaeon]|nr:hypothetical protein [Asgard group archaeon]
MKIPICTFCAQTGMLCSDCQKKLDSGEITPLDITISKIAVEFEKKNPEAANVTLIDIIDYPDLVVIIVESGESRFLQGKQASFAEQIEQEIHRSVKIVEKIGNTKKLIRMIFAPAKITGINTVFVPVRSAKPGQSSIEEELTVVIKKEDKDLLPSKLSNLKDLVKNLTGEEIRTTFR